MRSYFIARSAHSGTSFASLTHELRECLELQVASSGTSIGLGSKKCGFTVVYDCSGLFFASMLIVKMVLTFENDLRLPSRDKFKQESLVVVMQTVGEAGKTEKVNVTSNYVFT